MRISFTTCILAGLLCLVLIVPALHAQSPTTTSDLPTQFSIVSSGARSTLIPTLQSIKAAPLSASFQSESKQVLANGSTITDKRTGTIARDSEGRTYLEIITLRGPSANPPSSTTVNIADPVSHTHIVLMPDTHVARRYDMTPLPAGDVLQRRAATPEAGAAAASPARPTVVRPSLPAIQKEGLGMESIEGISVQHYRQTQTIPAGQIGNDQDLFIISEFWYSSELHLNLKATRNDPRFGEETLTVSDLDRVEPPASQFEIPADYTVTDVPRNTAGATSSGAAVPAQNPDRSANGATSLPVHFRIFSKK